MLGAAGAVGMALMVTTVAVETHPVVVFFAVTLIVEPGVNALKLVAVE